ncbi:uncharacterized protein LOC62_04G005255 [Vanrija pseudolonga]|uniref:F-box domain-containing protein n=1 Tax=Vanrija pseudolonga TaxID=143232 RepID=A0AAF1BM71_9TREE|nr:hypothetical protein LOC62_04G005255 [Vanrija pseudolonga]
MATIDHAYYPDIIDKIILNAPPETLTLFRATSRAFRDRIDALLAHVQMRRKIAPDSRSTMYFTSRLDPSRHLPFIPAVVRVLELSSDYDPGTREPERMVAQFTRLHTLRRLLVRGAPCPRAPVVVDILRLTGNTGSEVACHTSSLTRRHVIHAVMESVSLGVHLEFERDKRSPWLNPKDTPPRDYVLVYHFIDGIQDNLHTSMTAINFVIDLCYLVCDAGGSMTVVGAESRLMPGLVRQIGHVVNTIARDAMSDFDASELPTVRFLGLDDWRAELGDRCELEGYPEL